MECEEYEDAKLLKLLAGSHIFTDPLGNQKELAPPQDPKQRSLNAPISETIIEKLREISHREAEMYFALEEPMLSACSYLAINDIDGTIVQLIRENELFLAFAVCKLLGSKRINEVSQLLGLRAERLNLLDHAKLHYSNCTNKTEKLNFFAVRFKLNYESLGLKPMSEYGKPGENIIETITNLIMSEKIDEAATKVCDHIDKILRDKMYDKFYEVVRIISLLENIGIINIPLKYI